MKTRSVACVTIDCAIHTQSSTSHCSPTAKPQKKTAATLACKYGSWIKIVLYVTLSACYFISQSHEKYIVNSLYQNGSLHVISL